MRVDYKSEDTGVTLAKVFNRYMEANEALANGREDKAEYQLFMCFMTLGDFIYERDDWAVEFAEDGDDDE